MAWGTGGDKLSGRPPRRPIGRMQWKPGRRASQRGLPLVQGYDDDSDAEDLGHFDLAPDSSDDTGRTHQRPDHPQTSRPPPDQSQPPSQSRKEHNRTSARTHEASKGEQSQHQTHTHRPQLTQSRPTHDQRTTLTEAMADQSERRARARIELATIHKDEGDELFKHGDVFGALEA